MMTDTLAKNPYLDGAGNWNFSGSYDPDDVVFLLKPSSIEPTDIAEKESLIQSGERHYSEMLSVETVPDERYLKLYETALAANAARLRHDVEQLARAIQSRPQTSRSCVILSLARAGTPIGILLKNALTRLGVETFHYSIRSEEHTSELQSLMRISYAVFCLKKNKSQHRYINDMY